MQRIRIKTAPKLGDQVDYSFYDSRNRNTGMAGNAEEQVKNTMGPIPREEATIEVEKGEVVVGDTNEDGFLELFTFTGKPHSKGGTPVDVPPGSFIYSNTRKLRIKDPEVITKVFGLSEKKGGYTPAEIAKRYQINEHVATLKDERADNIQKRSASEMLKNNLQKLGVLALVQESMKGFPDGIPAIAESAAIGLGMDPAMFDPAKQQEMMAQQMPQEMPQDMQAMPEQMGEQPIMRYGGMPKYQKAGEVGSEFYINGKKNRIQKRYRGFFGGDGFGSTAGEEWVTFEQPIVMVDHYGNKEAMYEMKVSDFDKLANNGKLEMGYMDNFIAPSGYTSIDNLTWWNQDRSPHEIGRGTKINTLNFSTTPDQPVAQKPAHLQPGYTFKKGNKVYQVVDSEVYSPYGAEAGDRRAVSVKQVSDPDQNVGSFFDTKFGMELIPLSEFNNMMGVTGQAASGASGAQGAAGQQNYQGRPILNQRDAASSLRANTGNNGNVSQSQLQANALAMGWFSVQDYKNSGWKQNTKLLENARAMGWGNDIIGYRDSGWKQKPGAPANSGAAAPARTASKPAAKPAGKPQTAADALSELAYGGYALPRFQEGKTENTALTTTTAQGQADAQTNAAPDASAERFIKETTLNDGTVVYMYVNSASKQVIAKNAKGEIVSQQPMTPEQITKYTGQHSQYGSKQVQEILAKNPKTRYTFTNFGSFGSQGRLGNSGIYLSSGNQANRAQGDLSPQEWQDFYDRHGDWIESSYKGGFEQFKKDLQTSEQTGNNAAEWFQKKVNEFTQKEYGVDYFSPEASSDNPYSVDRKFGQVTYSVPRFFNEPTTPPETPKETPKPGMKQAFYCVEGEDGSRSVQTVEYPENGTPTAPTGKSVKQYASRADADAGCVVTREEFKQEPKKSGPWWAQDILTFTNTMTDSVNKYDPMMRQLDLLTSEYTPLKKDAQVANIQQMQNQFMNLAANSNDGNVATAAALGASGESFQNAANVMSQIENQNSLMATQNSRENVGIENQERQLNAGLRGQYVGEMATANQNFDNAQRRINFNRLEALKAGMTNYQRKKLQEQVLTPQVFIDPITYDASFSGQGRQWDLPDLYQNPYYGGTGGGRSGRGASAAATAAAAMSDNDIEMYDKYYNELLPKYGKEQAEKLAMSKMQQYNSLMRANPSAAQYTDQSLGYPGGFTPGLNPQAMGGAITIEDLFYMMNKANKR